MLVVVVAVGGMSVTIVNVVHVIIVRDGLVPAVFTVLVISNGVLGRSMVGTGVLVSHVAALLQWSSWTCTTASRMTCATC